MKPCTITLALAVAMAAEPSIAQPGPGQLAAETRQGLALRERYHVMPSGGEAMIYIESSSAHYYRYEYSTIARRAADGRWTVSTLGERGPSLLKIERELIPEEMHALTPEEGRTLDGLLASGSMYGEVAHNPRDIGAGASFHTMEVVTTRHHWVIRWTARLKGKAGKVANLLIGKGDS